MERRDTLASVLAAIGTFLVWVPVLAPLLFSVIVLATRGVFRFDYLMPAELFPATLVGGALLIWAALRARARVGLLAWSLGAAVAMLAGGQVLAVLTGLASGATGRSGLAFGLVVASLAASALANIVIGVGGLLLLRDLLARQGRGR